MTSLLGCQTKLYAKKAKFLSILDGRNLFKDFLSLPVSWPRRVCKMQGISIKVEQASLHLKGCHIALRKIFVDMTAAIKIVPKILLF